LAAVLRRRCDVVDVRLDAGVADVDADRDLPEFARVADGEVDDADERRLLLQRELEPITTNAVEELVPRGVEDLLFVEQF
jgi:hypothetical protein